MHKKLLTPKTIKPKKFIDKVEFIVGSSIQFPYDNGFGDKINKSSLGTIAYDLKPFAGYFIGLGLIHSFRQRFEISGRILWERKGYIEETSSFQPNTTLKEVDETKNEYITFLLKPSVFLGVTKKFQIFSGFYYSLLSNSFRQETLYVNRQITQVSSTTNNPILSNHDLGVLVGCGYQFYLSQRNQLGIQFQGNYGLSELININTLIIKNNSLYLMVSLKHNRSKN